MSRAAAASLLIIAAAFAASGRAQTGAEDLAVLRLRIGALRGEMDAAESSRKEARDSLRDSERAISDTNRSLRALETEQRAVREELSRTAAQRETLDRSVARQQALLGQLLASRYVAGPTDALRAALSGGDAGELARTLYYLAMLSRASATMIDNLRADSAEQARLEAIEAERRAERQTLLAQGRERRRLLEQLSGEISRQRRELKSLLADETRLSRLVEEIGRVIQSRPKAGYTRNEQLPEAGKGGLFSSLRGQLRLPVRGELAGHSSGQTSEPGRNAKGLFIRAAEGDGVRSVATGRVVFADWMRGFGNLLIVDHGEAYLTIYANNESLLKQPGDEVAAGDVIATVGASGGRAESGLYFELRHLGQAVDPLRWVKLR